MSRYTPNPLTQADFYKTGHVFQYPEGTTEVYSNFTPRSARLAPVIEGDFDNKVVWFGLQAFIKTVLLDSWNEGFFNQPKEKVVAAYKRRMDTSLGVDSVDVTHIEQLHDLGYLPIEIRSLPEGSCVDIRVPAMTVVNTRPESFWLTNYLETVMSNELWKMSTVATIARQYRRMLDSYADQTGAPQEFVDWQGHDFSCRGLSGQVDSAMVGAAHLTSFFGTDTIAAIDYLEQLYNANADKELIGGSVPATEHSVMCMNGEEGEIETFRRLVTKVYPAGVVSIVSDTWDFFKVITEYALELKEEILARKPNAIGLAKVVFRPDSGDPVKILTGYKYKKVSKKDSQDKQTMKKLRLLTEAIFVPEDDCFYEIERDGSLKPLSNAEAKGAVECLWDVFGGTINAKEFKVLNERVGLIYGDSITLSRAKQILQRLKEKGFASNNVVMGIGSYSYQLLSRDSFGWAMKATSGVVNGVRRTLFKDPATDSGTKRSAKGLLRVEEEGGRFVLYDEQTIEQSKGGALRSVFRDGELLIDEDLAMIRARVKSSL